MESDWVRSLGGSRITDEMMADYDARAGMKLDISNPFNTSADYGNIRKYMNGIGDSNPLHLDIRYAKASPYGALTAPYMWLVSVFPSWILQGLPGIHAIHTETEWEFYKPVFAGDEITPSSVFTGYEVKETAFGGRTVIEHQEAEYRNQKGELVARARPSGYRVERDRARESGRYSGMQLPYPWTDEELSKLENRILSEKARGGIPRFFEDVNIGDLLDPVTKGPLTLSDMIAFCIGADPVGIKAHGLALSDYKKHPAWCYRDPFSMGLEPVYSVHYSKYPAESLGLPYPYDLGIQRHCWLMQMLENWAGDYAWIKSCCARYRKFVFFSDAVCISGRVTDKYIDSTGDACVEIETGAVNQTGEDVMPGKAVIVLPRREDALAAIKKRLM